MEEQSVKKPKRRYKDTKQLGFRANKEMMARMALCENRTDFIRQCIDRVISGHIDLTEQMSAQIPRYERGVRTELVIFRAPGYMWKYIDEQEDRGCFIRACIQAQMDLENPLAFGTKNMQRVMFNPQANTSIPMVDAAIQCGTPVGADAHMGEMESLLDVLNFDPDEMFLMRAVGDSMKDAFVESGDYIVVRQGNHVPMPQELAVCELNGEFTLKHFFMYGGYGWLYPDNEDFEPIRIQQGEDMLSFRGTVERIIKNPVKNAHFDYDRCLAVMEKKNNN